MVTRVLCKVPAGGDTLTGWSSAQHLYCTVFVILLNPQKCTMVTAHNFSLFRASVTWSEDIAVLLL